MINEFHTAFSGLHTALEENLEVSIKARVTAEQKNLEDIVFIININQFVIIFAYDLSVLMPDLLITEAGWRRKLHARLLALSISEFFEDITELLGKNFRNKVELLGDKLISFDRLNAIMKQLNQLRLKHEKDLRSIRNIAIGHRDKDAKTQLDLINNLDVEGLQFLAKDVMEWLKSIIKFLTGVINKIAQESENKTYKSKA